MGEELFKLKSGQFLEGIPHKAWNAFVDAARYVKGQQGSLSRPAIRDVPQTGIVRVKNTTSGTKDRFEVLGIGGVFPEPTANLNAFKSGPVLHGVEPLGDTYRGRFAILLEPAFPDSIVSACVAGVCVAKVDVDQGMQSVHVARVGHRREVGARAVRQRACGSLRCCERRRKRVRGRPDPLYDTDL